MKCFWDWQVLCIIVWFCVRGSPWVSFQHVLFSSASVSSSLAAFPCALLYSTMEPGAMQRCYHDTEDGSSDFMLFTHIHMLSGLITFSLPTSWFKDEYFSFSRWSSLYYLPFFPVQGGKSQEEGLPLTTSACPWFWKWLWNPCRGTYLLNIRLLLSLNMFSAKLILHLEQKNTISISNTENSSLDFSY